MTTGGNTVRVAAGAFATASEGRGLTRYLVKHADVQRERLFMTDSRWLVCRSQDACAQRASVGWFDLAGMTFIAPTQDFIERLVITSGNSDHPLLALPQMTVINYTTAFGLVAAGFGITVAPNYARRIVVGYGLKMVRLEDAQGLMHEVCVWSRLDRHWSPAAEAFLHTLREVVA